MSNDFDYKDSVDWENLPEAPSGRDVSYRIPRSLWIPFCGAMSLVDLLNEAWSSPSTSPSRKTRHLLGIYVQLKEITRGEGGLFSYLLNVRDELFSSRTWAISFSHGLPQYTRSYHDGVLELAMEFEAAVNMKVWTKRRDMLGNPNYSVPFIDLDDPDPTVVRDFLLTEPIYGVEAEPPKKWNARYVKAQLESELYEAIGRRKLAGFSYNDDSLDVSITESPYKAQEEKYRPILEAYPQRKRLFRDLLFREWDEKEGLTPSEIRDRWNEMTTEDRKEICPTNPNKLELNAVKTILKRVKKL